MSSKARVSKRDRTLNSVKCSRRSSIIENQVEVLNLTISKSRTRFESAVSMEWWDRSCFSGC